MIHGVSDPGQIPGGSPGSNPKKKDPGSNPKKKKSRQQSRQAGSRFQERGLARSSSGKRLASLRKVRAFYTGFLGTAHVLEGGWRQKAGWGYRR